MNQKRFDVFYYNKAPPDLVLIYFSGCILDLLQAFHVKLGEPAQNLKLKPLFNPQELIVLNPLTMTGYRC